MTVIPRSCASRLSSVRIWTRKLASRWRRTPSHRCALPHEPASACASQSLHRGQLKPQTLRNAAQRCRRGRRRGSSVRAVPASNRWVQALDVLLPVAGSLRDEQNRGWTRTGSPRGWIGPAPPALPHRLVSRALHQQGAASAWRSHPRAPSPRRASDTSTLRIPWWTTSGPKELFEVGERATTTHLCYHKLHCVRPYRGAAGPSSNWRSGAVRARQRWHRLGIPCVLGWSCVEPVSSKE